MHKEQFEGLYKAHVDAVFRYCLRIMGDRGLAEDLTSEVFLKLYQQADTFECGSLPAWLFTVAKRRAIDHWRRDQVEARYAMMSPGPKSVVSSNFDVAGWIGRETGLKPVHRTCLLLHFVHSMSRAEVAARLNMKETQVKGHLQYGLKLLRQAAKSMDWDD